MVDARTAAGRRLRSFPCFPTPIGHRTQAREDSGGAKTGGGEPMPREAAADRTKPHLHHGRSRWSRSTRGSAHLPLADGDKAEYRAFEARGEKKGITKREGSTCAGGGRATPPRDERKPQGKGAVGCAGGGKEHATAHDPTNTTATRNNDLFCTGEH